MDRALEMQRHGLKSSYTRPEDRIPDASEESRNDECENRVIMARLKHPWDDNPITVHLVILAEYQLELAVNAENKATEMYSIAQDGSTNEAAVAANLLKEVLRQAVCKTQQMAHTFVEAAAAAAQFSAARNARAEEHAEICAKAYQEDQRILAVAFKARDEIAH